jgi:hypothetical protein
MKQNYFLAHRAAILLLVVFFSYCTKPPILIPAPQHYEITQISGTTPFGWTDTVRITYNNQHDPVQMAGQHISTGNPQSLFGYDAQRRLRILIGAYYDGNSSYETAHKYISDQKKRVVTDSIFYFGTYDRTTLTLLDSRYTSLRKYIYDSQDRITDMTELRFLNTSYTEKWSVRYFYNSSGNAYKISTIVENPDNTVSSTDVFPTYDNKTNPHQLHPVWQLIDLDYSKNNAFVADSYNKYGLPLHVTSTAVKYQSIVFLTNQFSNFEIVYGHK